MDAHHQSRRDEISGKAKRTTRNGANLLILRSEKRGLMYDPQLAQYAAAPPAHFSPPEGERGASQPLPPSCLQVADWLRDVLCEEEAEGFEPSMWIVDTCKNEEGEWFGYY